MALSLAEVARRAPEGDPISGPMTWTATGALHFAGINDDTRGVYQDELHMRQEGDRVSLLWRDPGMTAWYGPVLFDNFEELHNWIYEL